jgi:hypothetical protein
MYSVKDNEHNEGPECTLQKDGTLRQIISGFKFSLGMQGAYHGWVQSGIGDIRRWILRLSLLSRVTEPIPQERVSQAGLQSLNEFWSRSRTARVTIAFAIHV